MSSELNSYFLRAFHSNLFILPPGTCFVWKKKNQWWVVWALLLWLVVCSHDERGRAVKPACTMACESICAEFRVTFWVTFMNLLGLIALLVWERKTEILQGFFWEVLMGLQTCKYFTMEKYGAPQMFVCLQEQCMVWSLSLWVQRGLVGQVLCFTCRVRVILPCKETEWCDAQLF